MHNSTMGYKKQQKSNKKFWNNEYNRKHDNKGEYNLAISTNPSGDLVKFLHWLDKHIAKHGSDVHIGEGSYAYDIGCGNGRNLIYLAKEFGMVGSGFDISAEAIESATVLSEGLDLKYSVHAMDGTIDLPDNSVDLVLDMMASHFLDEAGRETLRSEIVRVLKPGGWLFYKTFLLDGDRNAKKLLRESPAGEEGSYIHPRMNVQEHASTEREVREEYGKDFNLHKVLKSHNHIKNGRAHKRRSIVLYAELDSSDN